MGVGMQNHQSGGLTPMAQPGMAQRVAIGIVLIGNVLWLPLPLLNGDELASPKNPSAANYTIRITPPNPPNAGLLFVDHSTNDRSGHLGHALVEYEDGKILAFYPNC